mmetsp:Transcript_10638/g.20115  ORF Transcript_10638/g.20115 Transcript_10638/m.20115 type:complete len:201 (-) Transcript_10638:2264-2866(-)
MRASWLTASKASMSTAGGLVGARMSMAVRGARASASMSCLAKVGEPSTRRLSRPMGAAMASGSRASSPFTNRPTAPPESSASWYARRSEPEAGCAGWEEKSAGCALKGRCRILATVGNNERTAGAPPGCACRCATRAGSITASRWCSRSRRSRNAAHPEGDAPAPAAGPLVAGAATALRETHSSASSASATSAGSRQGAE